MDMTYWCESCARKNNCYTIRSRPKCFTPIASNDRTADRKDENSSEKPNNCEPQIVEQAKADIEKRSSWSKTYEAMCEDEPQTMYYPQVDGITPSVIEPQFDKDINARSKYKQGTWLYGDGVYCSCCGYKLETTALLAKCPKCGADMSKTDCAWK